MVKWAYHFFKTLTILAVIFSLYCALFWFFDHLCSLINSDSTVVWVNHKALIYMFNGVNVFVPLGAICFLISLTLMYIQKVSDKSLMYIFVGYIIAIMVLGYGLYDFRMSWNSDIIMMQQEIWWLGGLK